MTNIPYVWVDDQQSAAQVVYPDSPVALFRVDNNGVYMRYRGEFYLIDAGSYSYGVVGRRWCIAGVWFNNDIIDWMLGNSVAYPFSPEDLMLYRLTWGGGCE